ncbi:MAG: LPS export ABC transporter ATP-binding protein [Gammaproteobacteria bacterium]|nr:LPS export ABC transporter ATP-binding protein [Gammaproteobacteria bacterium]MBP9729121.1 LPS export ABC transporter ATP-binding protein [Gammaproteobacteria bacterium]
MNTNHTLAVHTISKRYKNRLIVDNFSLHIKGGEIVGLLGPNGAGKTSCFYMMLGLVQTDSGNIQLNGVDITSMPVHIRARLGLGYLPQEASVFRKLSVADNILAILETREDLDAIEQETLLEKLLYDFRISHIRDIDGVHLSGGERRRVEIARALAREPKFILLDEPFAGVDPISIMDLKQTTRDLAKRGIGVLITDHNVRDTLDICDRAYIVHDGKVITEGDAAHILAHPEVLKVYLGEQFKL